MSRRPFGGTAADIVTDRFGNVVPGASGTVWTARTGGTQVTDLTDPEGDALSGGLLLPDDDGHVRFLGPDDDTAALWVDFGAGRFLLLATDLPDRVLELEESGPGGGSSVTLDADGTLVVDGLTVELVTDDQLAAEATARTAADTALSGAITTESAARDAAISTAISTAINALVNGAPGLLDTLAELAAAIGDDEDALAALTVLVNARVEKATFDANTILKADANDTPVALTVPASTVVGRAASGAIAALTVAQVKTLLALSSADLSDVANLVTDSELATSLAALTGTYLPLAGGALTGDLALGTHKITGLGDPTNPQDAATRAYVLAVRDALLNSAPGALDTLDELAAALGDDANFAATMTTALALKAPLASPALTGSPTAPTQTQTDNSTKIATTAYVDTLGATKAAALVTENAQTASYTLVLGDASKMVEVSNASANTLTVPPNSSVAFTVGTVINVRQYGAGQTTLTPGSGVTIRSRGAALKLAGQYAEASLIKRATDEWVATGDLTT